MESKNAKTSEYVQRAPVVTVMGHVDHGKTSILDALRKTKVQLGEYGGITQHTGAYQISYLGKKITFIDTPGHAAFSKMRARGGKAADLVVLVIAANEGVMPQTKEAISHARNAGVPIIVAFNKIDLPGADTKKIKQQLAQENILTEDWGGDVLSVELSAKTGQGLDKLLDAILAVSEIKSYKADKNGELEAVVIESKLDRKRGVVVSCIVKNGTIKTGDKVTASGITSKIKQMQNDNGEMIMSAGPSDPVEILGFDKAPNVGDLLLFEGSELSELAATTQGPEVIGVGTKRTVPLILKADTQGTLEAVKASLIDIITSTAGISFSLKILHSATGDINESDIMLADSAKGIVLGFNVRIPPSASELAETLKVRVKSYKAIYELIDEAIEVLEGSATQEEAKIKGRAQIIKIFKLPSGDVIAGCKVIAGALKVDQRIGLYDKDPDDVKPEDVPLYIGKIKKLKKGKDDINIAGKDTECGILFKPGFESLAVGQWLEVR